MNGILKYSFLFVLFLINDLLAQPNWPLTKSTTTLQVAIPAEFGTPYMQPISVDGWEDGIFVSRDGLNLYSIYLPADALSWTTNGAPCIFTPYQKGPTYGMNFTTTPTPSCPIWLHGDILISTRTSTALPFPAWTLSNLSGPVFSEGAPQFSMLNTTVSDLVVYTSNQQPPYNTDIYLIKNSTINPTATGTILPAPVTQTTTEDNPHLERISATQLVLFFDSPDRVGGVGGLDLWYATSNDDGVTWAAPQQVSTLNTTQNEHQPHLYKDNNNQWWLYYTTPDASGKYAIYRAQQTTANNWNSWGPKQLVVGPGNTAGIGEPTLTQAGDLSFVVVYQDANGTSTDKFDADAWFLPHAVVTGVKEEKQNNGISIFPNPAKDKIFINAAANFKDKKIIICDHVGQIVKEEIMHEDAAIDISALQAGIYFICSADKKFVPQKFIKE